jgi:hypothetical protein
MMKIHRQDSASVNTPPASVPTEPPMATAVQVASARLRLAGLW